ncbi:LOW QUALITY PROTEIN: probable glycosyltransferase At3g07620 [Dioscorea cayenensis subsp. rotundata]|uniref:LOW QUALITY PROTEIN: probable glycosyltransferase At3g07620 n=1 Tax=Dioscorea cayennensis subsp. rotundata TaxID=55577 RepID=A0AB40B5U8_DIOCR|nr:LOW QUALITY PROTEIN: probable glycosyltransferase At3g07620 [Dioscorea cayenensis subsp. rotundata]
MSKKGDHSFGFQKPCQTRTRKMVLVLGFMASMVFVFQIFQLSSGGALSHLFPTAQFPDQEVSALQHDAGSSSMRVGKFSLLSELQKSVNQSIILKDPGKLEPFDLEGKVDEHVKETGEQLEEEDDDDTNVDETDEFLLDIRDDDTVLKKIGDSVDGFITLEKVVEKEKGLAKKNVSEFTDGVSDGIDKFKPMEQNTLDEKSTYQGHAISVQMDDASGEKSSVPSINVASNSGSEGQQQTKVLSLEKGFMKIIPMDRTSVGARTPSPKKRMKKKKKRNLSPAYTSIKPQWSAAHDRQLLAIRAQIENASLITNDGELYAPAFRNISMFKRSYELMQRNLKVYVYKEGEKPIFHQPLLKGIYASEGWFMKLLEGSKHFVVRDPRKAHLFYIPFSSRLLQFALYTPNSHNRRALKEFLQNYVNTIAAKYPFWNRTGGADHFLVACHDWASYETRHTTGLAIRALCNADTHDSFILGKDVSLPETYVRSAANPLRDLGGMPANKRPTLAFFAGNLHGRLRPILLQHWENKDPDMKITGPMPGGVQSKMDYIEHMKSSKYCICPRGHEVNSPRIVESIFYECVPVIISDNYVPPFFEVLNWEVFSVIVAEKDVPGLKEILVSISEEKYLELQLGVRKVQRHFLWHSSPVKYDLFHMTLHCIWYNRLYQIRT